jgi:hypothetical protein
MDTAATKRRIAAAAPATPAASTRRRGCAAMCGPSICGFRCVISPQALEINFKPKPQTKDCLQSGIGKEGKCLVFPKKKENHHRK